MCSDLALSDNHLADMRGTIVELYEAGHETVVMITTIAPRARTRSKPPLLATMSEPLLGQEPPVV